VAAYFSSDLGGQQRKRWRAPRLRQCMVRFDAVVSEAAGVSRSQPSLGFKQPEDGDRIRTALGAALMVKVCSSVEFDVEGSLLVESGSSPRGSSLLGLLRSKRRV